MTAVGKSSPTLNGPSGDELAAVMEQELARGASPTLDLQRVGFVDHAGLSLLRQLQTRGVAIEGRSGFVAELLRSEDQP